MRSPRAYLVVLALALAVGNLWTTLHRSGIPMSLSGRVDGIEVRPEKHPGLDDVHLTTVGGDERHLDAALAAQMRQGDELRKAAWAATLDTPRGRVDLEVSQDFLRMALAMPLIVLLALRLLRGCRSSRSEADSRE